MRHEGGRPTVNLVNGFANCHALDRQKVICAKLGEAHILSSKLQNPAFCRLCDDFRSAIYASTTHMDCGDMAKKCQLPYRTKNMNFISFQ